jgi:hypothetical protein
MNQCRAVANNSANEKKRENAKKSRFGRGGVRPVVNRGVRKWIGPPPDYPKAVRATCLIEWVSGLPAARQGALQRVKQQRGINRYFQNTTGYKITSTRRFICMPLQLLLL